jgi:hypothetical protein
LLGDAGYVGCEDVITPHKRPPKGELTEEQHLFNRCVGWWRSTVEHVIGYVKRFQMIGGTYRGNLKTTRGRVVLFSAFKIAVHCSAMHIRAQPKRRFEDSIQRFGVYLDRLQASGTFKSHIDIKRDEARKRKMTAAERAEAAIEEEWFPADDPEFERPVAIAAASSASAAAGSAPAPPGAAPADSGGAPARGWSRAVAADDVKSRIRRSAAAIDAEGTAADRVVARSGTDTDSDAITAPPERRLLRRAPAQRRGVVGGNLSDYAAGTSDSDLELRRALKASERQFVAEQQTKKRRYDDGRTDHKHSA